MGILQFDARKTYFDSCGTKIEGAQKTEQAIKLAGLDFTVSKHQLYLADGTIAKNCFANVRDDTNTVLGQVKDRYEILQNNEAFDFMDSLCDQGANFVNAGCIKDGKKSYIVAETEPMKILGDEFKPYILFTNSFDGSTGVQAMFTPVRVFCSNCFVAASKEATNKITIKHSKNVKDRLMIARDTLLQNTKYLEFLKSRSEELATTKFTQSQFEDLVTDLVPISEIDLAENKNSAIVARAEDFRNAIMTAYNQDDLQNYNDSVYKAIMAIADADSHKEPNRNTGNEFYMMKRIMKGMVLLNVAAQLISHRINARVF